LNNFQVMPSSGVTNPATSNGKYPSWNDECTQAVTAAQAATAAGTTVYTVAYGAEKSGCTSDNGAYTPCQVMAAMASSPHYFYSDYNQSGSQSNCIASQPVTALNQIFTAIAQDLTTARLIPNGTT
jgi:hypothetical protein